MTMRKFEAYLDKNRNMHTISTIGFEDTNEFKVPCDAIGHLGRVDATNVNDAVTLFNERLKIIIKESPLTRMGVTDISCG